MAELAHERCRHGRASVRPLVLLHERDDGALLGECRPVGPVHRNVVATDHPQPDAEAPRLVIGHVRARRQLAARCLSGHPRFDVELAGGGRPEVTDRDVDDLCVQVEPCENRELRGENAFVRGVGLLRRDDAEELHLVKLVGARSQFTGSERWGVLALIPAP